MARRGRKLTVVLLVILVVLVGLFIAADRIAVYAADRTIADQTKKELSAQDVTAGGDPKVNVAGFPFLTQVLRGRYDKITIVVPKPSSQGVTVDELDITATGVNASTGALLHGSGQITADHVTGTARLGWAAVSQMINKSGYGGQGATVGALPDGELQVKAPIAALGLSTTLVATGNLTISGGKVQLKINKVATQGGQVPSLFNKLLGSIKQALSIEIAIPPLPYNLVIHDVHATTQGVEITANAQHVPISGSG